MTSSTDYNNDRIYQPVNNNVNYENNKWDACSQQRQENTKYGFNVNPGGFVITGARPQIIPGAGEKFQDGAQNNPLNLINKK